MYPQIFETLLSPGSGNIISISREESETKIEIFTSKLF